MLEVVVPYAELWDNKKEEFIKVPETKLALEHSLVSISKWEAKWHKPFLGKEKKTEEEILYYIKCMTLTPKVDPNIYRVLTQKVVDEIENYIYNPMTATTINERSTTKSRRVVTSELIYYWMVELRIPVEFQKWHLNRLLTLIQVCNIENKPKKKMSKRELMRRNASLNAARRASMNSKG